MNPWHATKATHVRLSTAFAIPHCYMSAIDPQDLCHPKRPMQYRLASCNVKKAMKNICHMAFNGSHTMSHQAVSQGSQPCSCLERRFCHRAMLSIPSSRPQRHPLPATRGLLRTLSSGEVRDHARRLRPEGNPPERKHPIAGAKTDDIATQRQCQKPSARIAAAGQCYNE